MDQKTIDTYNAKAEEIAARHLAQSPTRLYELIKAFFIKDEPTVDLGCGSGRDTHWLSTNFYPVVGLDPSLGMLEQARNAFPGPSIKFEQASLPHLNNIAANSFQNIFCSAVLMHIPSKDILSAINNILRISRDGAIIIISFRGSHTCDKWEGDRLFEPYSLDHIAQLFESFGGKVLYSETEEVWKTLVIRKSSLDQKAGISRIQDILEKDSKVTTYKFALIRALCEISKYEPSIVTWDHELDMVAIPMKRIAYRWVGYYWHLLRENMKQIKSGKLGFATPLIQLKEVYQTNDLALLMRRLNTNELSSAEKNLFKSIAKAISEGPVKHAGGGINKIFKYQKSGEIPEHLKTKPEVEYGLVYVPMDIWRDISLFSTWIEDSLLIRWAEFTRRINDAEDSSAYLAVLAKPIFPLRDTAHIKKLFKGQQINCIWSGAKIKDFDVDHLIPWSLWKNNDFWNLLPAAPHLNRNKSDSLPSPELIAKNFHLIRDYWDLYAKSFEDVFARQLLFSLSLKVNDLSESDKCMDALINNIQRIHINQSRDYWSYQRQ